MNNNIHWFITQEDCEQFFSRMAKNNDEELTPDFVFEGNSEKKYGWVIALSKIVGYENLGVREKDYKNDEIEFIDEFFIKPANNIQHSGDIRSVDIDADEATIMPDGSISLWWD